MRIQLYLDEDASSRSLARGLRTRGVEVLTTVEAGMLQRNDEAQLDFATRQNRVVYTYNVADFCRLHAAYVHQGKDHSGIIVVAQSRFTIGEQLRRVLKLLAAKSAEEMHNQIEFLSAWNP